MIETLMFFAFIGAILYVIAWAMIKDDGQIDWTEAYKNKQEKEEEQPEEEKWTPDS